MLTPRCASPGLQDEKREFVWGVRRDIDGLMNGEVPERPRRAEWRSLARDLDACGVKDV